MYLFKKIFKIDFEKLNSQIEICSKKSGKSKIKIFFDMAICVVFYQAGYMDYEFFEMYNLNRKQRKEIKEQITLYKTMRVNLLKNDFYRSDDEGNTSTFSTLFKVPINSPN